MRQPNKPHRDGYEDEEDCEGYYDPDERERRGCPYVKELRPNNPCRICQETWQTKEDARWKAEWDAKTPEERTAHEALVKGLKELY